MVNEKQITEAAEQLDHHVAEIINWHFSEKTGSSFWLNWAKEQNWNPLEEVHTFGDLSAKNFLTLKMAG